MRKKTVLSVLLFFAQLATVGNGLARDFIQLPDQTISPVRSGSNSTQSVDPVESTSEHQADPVQSSAGNSPAKQQASQKEKIPNPFIMGRGYENQGTNMAVFGEMLKSRKEGENETGSTE